MKFTDFDLKQIDDSALEALSPSQLLSLSRRLLTDLKKAREQLNQNPGNSSRPSGSMPPWECGSKEEDSGDSEDDEPEPAPGTDEDGIGEASVAGTDAPADSASTATPDAKKQTPASSTLPEKKRPGKQRGAPGFGRTQQLPVTATEHHKSAFCVVCESSLAGANHVAWTSWDCIDVAEPVPGKPGILLTNTRHVVFQADCPCGHCNRVEPFRSTPDAAWPGVSIGEWRLVGPRFAAMIVLLSKRHRNSVRLIRELLHDFLGIELSVGTISKTIREAGRSVAPLEEELVRELEKASLVYADETSWKESGSLLWLWVFRTLTMAYFVVGKRDRTLITKLLLTGRFKGTVMSDGWIVYRECPDRLRCWAHLIRKARGLSESYTTVVSETGMAILTALTAFQDAIYAAREQPGQQPGALMARYRDELEHLKALCVAYQESRHEKLQAFVRELLNDWDTIFRQLQDPTLPLTNNEAERSLRHWVIERRLSHGTRTPEGTRSLTLLASVIETCRIRGAPLWDYLTRVIAAARKGLQIPCLPAVQAG